MSHNTVTSLMKSSFSVCTIDSQNAVLLCLAYRYPTDNSRTTPLEGLASRSFVGACHMLYRKSIYWASSSESVSITNLAGWRCVVQNNGKSALQILFLLGSGTADMHSVVALAVNYWCVIVYEIEYAQPWLTAIVSKIVRRVVSPIIFTLYTRCSPLAHSRILHVSELEWRVRNNTHIWIRLLLNVLLVTWRQRLCTSVRTGDGHFEHVMWIWHDLLHVWRFWDNSFFVTSIIC